MNIDISKIAQELLVELREQEILHKGVVEGVRLLHERVRLAVVAQSPQEEKPIEPAESTESVGSFDFIPIQLR